MSVYTYDELQAARAKQKARRRAANDDGPPPADEPPPDVAARLDEEEGPAAAPKRRRQASDRPSHDDDERPKVEVTVDLERTVRRALELLPDDPELYQRGGALVRVVHDAEPSGRVAFAPGAPRLRAVDAPVLRYRLAALARWVRFDRRSEEWKVTRPDSDTVAAIASLGEWPGVRPIVGVAEAPILRPDGTIHDVAGYDQATGYVYEPGADFGRIPEQPTRDDARRAWAELAEPFGEFPWATPASLAAAVSAVLTLLARPAIDGPVPAVLFDKNAPGTGGSLCTDAVALIATGRPSPRMSWPPTPEECGKILDAYALRSAALVNFDNIPPSLPFAGAALDKYTTATSVECRVLGRSEAPNVQWRALIMGSGNNITIAGDTVRRVLRARMETDLERPQDRDGFKVPDLRAWVRERRVRLVRAALVLLRAYHAAGRPDVGLKPWGSFEAWTALIPAAIVWAGGPNPLDARLDATTSGDPELAALAAVLVHLPRLAPQGATLRTVLGALYPQGKAPDVNGPPDGHDDLREALEVLAPPPRPGLALDARKLGNALRRFLRVVRGDRRLACSLDRKGVAVWSVESVGALS